MSDTPTAPIRVLDAAISARAYELMQQAQAEHSAAQRAHQAALALPPEKRPDPLPADPEPLKGWDHFVNLAFAEREAKAPAAPAATTADEPAADPAD